MELQLREARSPNIVATLSGRVTRLGVRSQQTACDRTSRSRPAARGRVHEVQRSTGSAGILGTIL
jgi:hypothetical protein